VTDWGKLFVIFQKNKNGTWLCIPSKCFSSWFSDMTGHMKLFSEFQQPQ